MKVFVIHVNNVITKQQKNAILHYMFNVNMRRDPHISVTNAIIKQQAVAISKIISKHSCGQCDFKTNRKQILQKHVQCKHEGVRYLCDQCDYKATEMSSLRSHIKSQHLKKRIDLSLIHDGEVFSCEKCDRQYQLKTSLGRHMMSAHKGIL